MQSCLQIYNITLYCDYPTPDGSSRMFTAIPQRPSRSTLTSNPNKVWPSIGEPSLYRTRMQWNLHWNWPDQERPLTWQWMNSLLWRTAKLFFSVRNPDMISPSCSPVFSMNMWSTSRPLLHPSLVQMPILSWSPLKRKKAALDLF